MYLFSCADNFTGGASRSSPWHVRRWTVLTVRLCYICLLSCPLHENIWMPHVSISDIAWIVFKLSYGLLWIISTPQLSMLLIIWCIPFLFFFIVFVWSRRYAERLRVFLKGVRAIRDANEVVHPQRLRALLDVPEPRTGSYLITAVKQRKLDAIRVLTGIVFAVNAKLSLKFSYTYFYVLCHLEVHSING